MQLIYAPNLPPSPCKYCKVHSNPMQHKYLRPTMENECANMQIVNKRVWWSAEGSNKGPAASKSVVGISSLLAVMHVHYLTSYFRMKTLSYDNSFYNHQRTHRWVGGLWSWTVFVIYNMYSYSKTSPHSGFHFRWFKLAQPIPGHCGEQSVSINQPNQVYVVSTTAYIEAAVEELILEDVLNMARHFYSSERNNPCHKKNNNK